MTIDIGESVNNLRITTLAAKQQGAPVHLANGRYMLEVVGGKQSEPRLIQSGGIVVYPDSYESVYSLMRGVNPSLLETVFTDIRGGVD